MDLARKFTGKKNGLISFKKLSKAIAEDIKEDIISGHYKSGERLKEADLAEKYSVSKTPIREAIRYLEGVGFIEMIPHTMIRVTKMDKKEVQNLTKNNDTHKENSKDKASMAVNPYEHDYRKDIKKDMLSAF